MLYVCENSCKSQEPKIRFMLFSEMNVGAEGRENERMVRYELCSFEATPETARQTGYLTYSVLDGIILYPRSYSEFLAGT